MKRPTLSLLFGLTLLLFSSCSTSVSSDGQPGVPTVGGTKFHPGHYGLIPGWSTVERELPKIVGTHFKGFQVRYAWRTLETEKDVYDFSTIESDLRQLTAHGLRLVIQLQDKSFTDTPEVPDYILTDTTYGGGVLSFSGANGRGSFPLLWNQAVLNRERALLQALGARFDEDPFFEALTFPETAFQGQGNPSFGYSDTGYFDALVRRMADARQAFPHTVVIQYANWLSGPTIGTAQVALGSLAMALEDIGGGWGGPDIVPHPLPGHTPIPAFPMYAQHAGKMALGASVQVPEMGGKEGTFTADELYTMGVETLHLNYMFWVTVEDTPGNEHPPGFTKGVLPYVEANGGVVANTACPTNLAPCAQ